MDSDDFKAATGTMSVGERRSDEQELGEPYAHRARDRPRRSHDAGYAEIVLSDGAEAIAVFSPRAAPVLVHRFRSGPASRPAPA